MKKIIYIMIIFLITVSCSNKEEKSSNKIKIFTSILPQKFLVEKIASDTFDVNVIVGPGKSPATYEPTPEQVINLGKASILFTLGVPFENAFLKNIKSTLKNIKIVDTSYGIKKRMLKAHDHHESEKNGHHDDEKGTEDPHTWLSPITGKIHAKNIYKALSELRPDKKDLFKKNYDKLIDELSSLHRNLKKTLKPLKGKIIFVFHPAFGYFADTYGLTQEAIETGGKSPKPAQLVAMIKEAIDEKVKVIFVQPEFPEKSAQAVAKAIGGSVVKLNPLNPDYIKNMENIASQIKKSLK